MPKALCITGMVISVLIVLLFLIDLLLALVGLRWLAPFRGASYLMDIVFVVCGLLLGYMSWSTFKEQK